jgi:UDP-glucose 4-epimerase
VVVLVTGAHGFLGSHVARFLSAGGDEVRPAGRPQIEIPSPEFEALFTEVRPSAVVHCAGPASVPASVAEPEADFRGSVDVLRALLDGLRGLNTRLVLISSAAVYGQPESLPVDETHPLRPISPYGEHRAACELLLREVYELDGVRSCALRVFSAYGEGLRRQIMWDICRQALQGDLVELDGTGGESRDFVHARDIAAAVSVVLRAAEMRAEAYNVGTGRETTIRELAELLVGALGRRVEISFSGRARPGDPAHWRADIDRLAGLGFRPSVALEDGVPGYAAWAAREPVTV